MAEEGKDGALHVHAGVLPTIAGIAEVLAVGGESDVVELDLVKAAGDKFVRKGRYVVPHLLRVRINPTFVVIRGDEFEFIQVPRGRPRTG